MKPIGKVGVIALMLVLAALPTMACMVPSAVMTSAERACCKQMANQCGEKGMAKSHSCCQRVVGLDGSRFLTGSSVQLDHQLKFQYSAVLPVMIAVSAGTHLVLTEWDIGIHGPPGLTPLTISVLRI